MNKEEDLQKYKIEGLDCPQCASDLEKALQKQEGLNNITVDFVTQTLKLPPERLSQALKVVRRMEPNARIIVPENLRPQDQGQYHRDTYKPKGTAQSESWSYKLRFIRIGAGTILTLIGIIFNPALHSTPYHWAEYAILLGAYILVGAPVIAKAIKNILRGRVFDEMLLMTIATLGAIAIHELSEAVAVMLFYSVGEYFQDLAVDRSRRSITSLLDLRPDTARVVRGGEVVEMSPEDVETGSVIEVRPGERVPLDGEILEGESFVDTSALTGESVPRIVSEGDKVLAGFINESGKIRIRATKIFAESSVSRILELVENASSRKAPTERFISRFASYYTPVMVGLAAMVAFIPPLIIPGAMLSEWIYRALVLLVISCPCALVLSIPLGYFGGIGGASRNSILIKGANYIDALKNVETVVLDKTGTLTKGVFRVTETVPRNGYRPEDVLYWAALAEAHSTHPLAHSIRNAYPGEIPVNSVSRVKEEKGYGVSAVIEGRTILAGNDKLLHREGIEHEDCKVEGTVVYVVLEGVYIGYLLVSDEIKPEAAQTIAALRTLGAKRIVMLTGDNRKIAEQVAGALGIDEFLAELLPEEKVEAVEGLKGELKKGRNLAFVGDGINDAPVLMSADLGIAMGALGSDAAIEAADIVLMDDRIDRIPMAIGIARFTRKVVIQNIVMALLVKAVFLAFGAFGLATIWEAVIADVGIALLAVLNSMRTIRGGKRF